MIRHIPYVSNELRVIDTMPAMFGGPGYPLRNTPVSPRENYAALYFEKHPYWIPMPGESSMIRPTLYNERLGRGGPGGVTDTFGIQWEYVPAVGGSIVHPGEPLMKNANDWKDIIKIPNVDEWDWAGEAAKTACDTRVSNEMSFVNGFWFERLISFMDFAPAAMALIDEDQQDAVKELFAAMTDLGCKLVDKFCEYWPALDGFNVHDDWAAQRSPFFSQEVADELFVPYMKALTDHIHSKGRYATLHSCGHGEDRVKCFIDGGFDAWDPQTMNNTYKLFEEFGDKICIGIVPQYKDLASMSEDDQRNLGREFAKQFSRAGKPVKLGNYANGVMTPAFAEEVYITSRNIFNS